jgi:hypothetical protein
VFIKLTEQVKYRGLPYAVFILFVKTVLFSGNVCVDETKIFAHTAADISHVNTEC